MKKYLFLIACMLNCILASAQYSGSGNGTEDDPYLIYNETQLYQMNNFLGSDHAGVVFKLMKDLDLGDFISDNFPSEGWMPVGVESTPFEGKFYGNNHRLSGLWINRTSTNNVGLFGYTTNATIQDLTLEESSIKANNYVGSVVGQSISSTVSNCSVTASSGVSGGGSIGGIIGNSTSTTISQCSYNGTITETATSCGGIVGYITNGSIASSNATSTITGTTNVGGIAGYDSGANISDCKMTGDINGSSNVGGIFGVALSTFTISNSKYVGDVKGSSNIAGVAGSLQAGSSITFNNSHSKGKITNTGDYTGGIVGISNGGCIAGMENCSHFGDINGKNYIGGLIGASKGNTSSDSDLTFYISSSNSSNDKIVTKSASSFMDEKIYAINNCTSVGNITGYLHIGGLVGEDAGKICILSWETGGKTSISLSGYYAYTTRYLWFGNTYTGSSIWQNSPSACFSWSPNICSVEYLYTNSYYSGNISGTDNVGGIAGYKWCGKIQNCYTNATVYGNKNVGGIIGNAEGHPTYTMTLKSNVAINNTISATEGNIGRIYGTKNDYLTIGALASAEGNRALTTTKVIKQGVVQEVTDDFQNGNVMGKSLLKLKANYVALGWDFDNNWDILETECFPYKKYQAAPPVIESNLVSQDTQISGSSTNGGTVYLYYKDRDAVSTTCSGNAWSFTTEALQSGAAVQLYADVDNMTPSYLTSTTVGYPGSGTEADPYRIYTAEDLQGASNKGYYKLMNDIDLASWINENSPTEGWVAIGRNSGEATYINGDGHKVTGLWINTTQDYTGLFSNFSAGIIKNLTVEVASGKKVKGGDYTGVLIGRNANGQLLNCTVKGDVEGTTHVGGVTGYSGNNTVNAVTYEGKVTSSTANAYVGGFAGLSESDAITAIHVYPTISATGSDNYVGGAIGYMNGGTITKSQAENTLTATGANDYVGGLVGYSKGEITLSYSTGTVTASGDNSYTGGLVGYAYNPITNCYSTAKTTGTYYTAGICAYTFSTIDKCYAKGDVYGSRYGGGVVAQLDGSAAALTNSIAANTKLELTDQSSWGSRVIGGFKNGAVEPDESNYALSTMQVSLNGVAQKKTDDAVEGIAKAEADLMKAQTYIDLGWDYSAVWGIDEGTIYPYLLWEIDVNPVTEITLDKTSVIIANGNTETISASIMPLGATNKRLAWTTGNSAIATVEDGVITATGIGSTTITATSTDGSNVSATCKVQVVANHDAAIAELQALVDNAQSLYDNSTEGENIGQYQSGARAALLAVIKSVKAQISSTMDDATITSCTNDINNAVTTFNSKKVTAGEDTDLTAYDNVLYIEKAEAAAGQQVTLSLKMNNTVAPTGFQCDVYLPDGVEIAKDEDDFYLTELSTERTTAKKTDYFNSADQSDGSVRIMCSSTKSYTFSGNEGEVAKITVNISKDIDEGTYPLILKNIVISDAKATGAKVSYVKTTLTISSYTLGDANNDGGIDVMDFTAIANHILGSTPATFVEKAADVNADNEINVMDLTGEANLILYGSVTPDVSSAKGDLIENVSFASISASDVNTNAGNAFTLNIGVDGNYGFSGYQFDIALPEGMSVLTQDGMPCVDLSTERTNAKNTDFFSCGTIKDGSMRVLCASSKGSLFEGNSGSVATLNVMVNEDVLPGDYEVSINNVILSADGLGYNPSNAKVIVHVDDATGINSIAVDGKCTEAYSLTGVKLGTLKSLAKGVYIINGKKILK